jgi:copper(I)-binding protein
MRLRVSTVGAGVVAVIGVAALLRAAVPVHAPANSADSMPGMQMGSPTSTSAGSLSAGGSAGAGGPISVSGVFVAEPATPSVVAVYMTFTNNTSTDDRLVKVVSGAGQTTTIHTGTSMNVAPQGLPIPAHKVVALSVGKGHIMIQDVIGTIVPGQTVDIQLIFDRAPTLIVQAPVIAIGAPTPKEG